MGTQAYLTMLDMAWSDYRYCVIGAGIVGLSTAYHLLADDPDASVVVLEAEDAVATHQTGHNSGVIHSGIYYEPGSLKATFAKAGERATKDFCRTARHRVRRVRQADRRHRPPWNSNGWPPSSSAPRSTASPVGGSSGPSLAELEPNIIGLGALHLPRTGIVDYPQIARTLADLVAA